MSVMRRMVWALLAVCFCTALAAQSPVTVGPETGLPMPRFVSLKTGEAYARRGPSFEHRIDWIYTQRDLPVRITAEHGHWRRVEDVDGQGGWVHYTLLSGVRSAIVAEDNLAVHYRPAADADLMARLAVGRVTRIYSCQPDWCRVDADGRRGWVRPEGLWGVMPGEVID